MRVTEFSADAWQGSAQALQQGLAERMDAVDKLTHGLHALAESKNITGEGADGMRAYIREVHVPVLQCLLLGLSTFQTAVGVYWAGYRQVDADGNFHLVRDEHETHVTQLDAAMRQLRGIGSQLRQISADASHLVSLGSAGAGAAEQTGDDLQRMHLIVKAQLETWEAYEGSDPGFAQVEELISRLGGIVNRVGSVNVGRGRSYMPGSFQAELVPLGELMAGMSQYCQDNQHRATEGWQDMFDKYAQDVDAARREQALTDLIWDGLQILAGAVVTVIGLGLTPFTAGFSLGLTAIGGALLVGGINNAINHASIAATGEELDLAGMAGKWWDASVARPVADWGGDWQYVGGFLSGAGHAVTGMAQLNVHAIGAGVTALVTDAAAREALWQQVAGFVDQIANGDKFAIGHVVGEAASLFIPGAAVARFSRGGGVLTKASGGVNGLVKQPQLPAPVKPPKVPAPVPGSVGQVEALKDALTEATRAKDIPGYDPTGGLGWDRFLEKHLNGFDSKGRPAWKWPDAPPHTSGFMNGISKPADLAPGDTLERITFLDKGGLPVDGDFAAPPGTAFDKLSLPPDRLGGNTMVVKYEVIKQLPENVRMGQIAPGFEQPGLGTQFHFPGGIQKLDPEYLKVIP